MSKILILLVLIASPIAHAYSLECHNSKVKISSHAYDGGAQPMHGMVVSAESWTYRGKVVGSREYHYLESAIDSGRLGEFVDGTEVVLDAAHANDKPWGTIKYKVKARVPMSDTGTDALETTVYCVKTVATIPFP